MAKALQDILARVDAIEKNSDVVHGVDELAQGFDEEGLCLNGSLLLSLGSLLLLLMDLSGRRLARGPWITRSGSTECLTLTALALGSLPLGFVLALLLLSSNSL